MTSYGYGYWGYVPGYGYGPDIVEDYVYVDIGEGCVDCSEECECEDADEAQNGPGD